ncbi:hypothetical protein N7G274_006396 [Stereocaulon virgatum]|uniref:Translation initiation factor beta propellor-like domain-containing protein n=1 Tax=Stereocaulon virgatum TaxID=373712 RepID=A0ABR4A7A1_9LECA
MAAGSLTSDHVNYLIWRYLQESGHGEAAVKLQRDWLQDPQSLPFAQRIKTHALVSLVQKGLRYHQIEHVLDQPGNQSASSAATLFFGAESGRVTSSTNHEQFDDAAQSSPRPRKHGREVTTNGLGLDFATPIPAPKRPRRSNNGTETPLNGDRQITDSMQIDQNGYHYQQEPPMPVSPPGYSPTEDGANGMDLDEDADAPGSPTPEDQLIHLLTNGPSRAVQSDKVNELGPQTSVLRVPDKTHVIHTAWNPKDPTILAVAGEALCRVWYIPRTASFVDNQKSFVDILDPVYPSLVTTMAWNPTGEILAVATRDDTSDWVGAVSLWSKTGKALDELPAAQDTVLTLRWSPSGNQLLGITVSGASTSSLILWDINSSQAMPPYQLPNTIRDAAWISNNQITICGHDIIASSLLEGGRILALHTRPDPESQQTWSHICYDSRTHTIALAAEDAGILGLIDSSDALRTNTAHEEQITALAYQPVTNLSAYPASAPRLLATSSLDGTIKIWDAKRPLHWCIISFSAMQCLRWLCLSLQTVSWSQVRIGTGHSFGTRKLGACRRQAGKAIWEG